MQTIAIAAVVVLISSVVGFVTGVLLSRQVLNETKALEQKVTNAFNAVVNDIRTLDQRVNSVAGGKKPDQPFLVLPPPTVPVS